MNIAVIGAGSAGRQFALDCASAGHEVTLEDVMPEKLRRALAEFPPNTLRVATTVEDAVHSADLAVDFVPDELESKLEILSLLDRMAPPRTVFLTPSDVLSITDLASCTYRPAQTLMLRGPATLLTTRHTSQQALTLAETLLRTLGLTPNTLPDPDLPQLMKNMGVTTF